MEIIDAVKRAMNNIIKEGITDVELFARPFEIDLISNDKNKDIIIQHVVNCIKTAISGDKEKIVENLELRQIGKVLVPKKRNYDFRKCALIDVIDEIKYLAIVLLLANKIEKKRISKNNNTIFSYRYNAADTNGWLFHRNIGMAAFRNCNLRNSRKQKYKVVVECDISNFYDRLNIHRLESTLLSTVAKSNDEQKIVEIINQILLFWSNRDSYDLPVGSNASRILAEASLIDIDKYLLDNKIPFTRFVDDFRLFATSAEQANKFLSLLINRLAQDGLFLNSGKTKIIDISEQKEDNNLYDEEIKILEKSPEEKRIISGYVGLVPTKFRKLSYSEIVKYKELNPIELIESLKNKVVIKESDEEIKKCIKSIVAQDQYALIKDLPYILHKSPQFIPYFIDMVRKNSSNIDEEIIESIKDDFSKWFDEQQVPEYILVYLVRIFNSENLKDKQVLLNYFRKLPRNSGDYIGRALLEALHQNLDRSEILEIREYFNRADNWEKRQIFNIIVQGLSKDEANAFYRNIIKSNTDPLLPLIKNTITTA